MLAVVHFSAFGGPHNRTAEVARMLAEQGVETIVAIPEEPGSAFSRLTSRGLDVYQLPIERIRRTKDVRVHSQIARSIIPSMNALRALIRERDVDIVALNALGAPHLGIAARLEEVPVVWQLIDTYPHPVVRAAFMPVVRRCADVVMTTGRAVAEQHPGALAFGDRLFSFFPCVDMSRFTRTAEGRERARLELGIADGEHVVGSVGNLGPMKGHRTFLRAAALVRQRAPHTRFVLLGAQYNQFPGYWDGILALADELGLSGNLIVRDPGGRVAELAQAFDVFWMTSELHSEGIPTVIGEAMALELPVVAGRVGAIDEGVIEAVTGFVVAPVKAEAMVEPTLRLLEDPSLRANMGAAGREAALGTFAADVGARQHLRAYEAAVAHRRAHKALPSKRGVSRRGSAPRPNERRDN